MVAKKIPTNTEQASSALALKSRHERTLQMRRQSIVIVADRLQKRL